MGAVSGPADAGRARARPAPGAPPASQPEGGSARGRRGGAWSRRNARRRRSPRRPPRATRPASRAAAAGGGWAPHGIDPTPCERDPGALPRRDPRRPSTSPRRSSGCATRSSAITGGEWVMPAKVYLDSPPHGDFRAMPARGGELAMLKWISSFPSQPVAATADGIGVLVRLATPRPPSRWRSSTRARSPRCAPGRSPRSRRRRWPADARPAIVGCGVNGAWAARCLAAAGFGPGVCHDADRRGRPGAGRRARLARWAAAPRRSPSDVVTCVTPGHEVVVDAGDLRPGMHLNMLGADGPGKAEATVGAVALAARCSATSGSRPPTAAS